MLVRSKEGKFFEIDEETLKGKEVEAPAGGQQQQPEGCQQGGPMQVNIPGGQGGAPLIVINIAPSAPVSAFPQGSLQSGEKAPKDAEGKQCWFHRDVWFHRDIVWFHRDFGW